MPRSSHISRTANRDEQTINRTIGKHHNIKRSPPSDTGKTHRDNRWTKSERTSHRWIRRLNKEQLQKLGNNHRNKHNHSDIRNTIPTKIKCQKCPRNPLNSHIVNENY